MKAESGRICLCVCVRYKFYFTNLVPLARKPAFLHHLPGKQNHSLVPCEIPTLSFFDVQIIFNVVCSVEFPFTTLLLQSTQKRTEGNTLIYDFRYLKSQKQVLSGFQCGQMDFVLGEDYRVHFSELIIRFHCYAINTRHTKKKTKLETVQQKKPRKRNVIKD